MKIRATFLFLVAFVLGIDCVDSSAQSLRLRQQLTNLNRLSVSVGERVDFEIFADLQGVEAAGISIFITVPEDAFQVVDKGLPGQIGTQPFEPGSLFVGATPGPNLLLPETDPAAQAFAGQQLEYSLILGGGSDRVRTGSGVVATFSLICVKPVENARIIIDDNAVRESRLVLSDGVSERRFTTIQPMEITVTGIQLRDIPDVILMPGQADSLTIGSLNSYIVHTLSDIDSLRWSYDAPDLDSLTIEIDEATKRVKVTPTEGWTGRQEVLWTVTEPVARVQGLPPLSATDLSTIIVNNPPLFTVASDAGGVKRDTISFREDLYPFLPGGTPNTRRAFRWEEDLYSLVDDPDVINPENELFFAVLVYGGQGNNNIKAQIDQSTNDLLVWSRANYSGLDSLKILVRDGQRGGEDSLRVIIDILGENDPPTFILEDKEPKVSRGGEKSYLLHEIIEDPDTHLDSLVFTWVDDPGAHFSIDTVHAAEGVRITVKGIEDFVGDGRITFRIEDPEDPETLFDQILLFIAASEVLPPDILTTDAKIELVPGGDSVTLPLDNFVNDPDNSPDQLAWLLPPGDFNVVMGIDENRNFTVSAPLDFVGYQEVPLTVSDPSDQSDVLTLRIYSSDGRPVVGGLPDEILDRGDSVQEIDLDSYFYDADNLDEEVFWETLNTFDENNLQVRIDPQTHLVEYFVPETAIFKTETVIFRVTDPAGTSATDTVLVTVRSGGDQGGGATHFRLLPLPTDLQAPVDRYTNVLDLDNYVIPPDSSLSWSVTVLAGENSVSRVAEGNILSIYGIQSGIDTLKFTALDSLGRTKTITGTVRIFGESEVLRLLSIPDIQFIAGQQFISDSLNTYIADRESHPDSLIQWSVETVGPQGTIFVRVNADNTVLATAPDTGEALVALIARDLEVGVAGRDTIRVVALDPALGSKPLKDFPSMVVISGAVDSSITLNDFLPDEFEVDDPGTTKIRWTVSGQQITQPIIDPEPPHVLHMKGVGDKLGLENLTFVADLGGGFLASGEMEVAVVEPVDESTLDLQVVPNPVNPLFIDVFVIARREMASTPNVIRSFETSDSTVAVRQVESNLLESGVLIWTGSVRLRRGATGTALFRAQAVTALGTSVTDTTSVSFTTTVAGKAVMVQHQKTKLRLPADAVLPGTPILLQSGDGASQRRRGKLLKSGEWGALQDGELQLRTWIDIYPAGQSLRSVGSLQISGEVSPKDGVYCLERGLWNYIGRAERSVEIDRLDSYAVLRDEVPPQIYLLATPGPGRDELVAELVDKGSGIGADGIRLLLDGNETEGVFNEGVLIWAASALAGGERHALSLVVRDRVGNESARHIDFVADGQSLPQATRLGSNFPNPFNPETTIPLSIAPVLESGGEEVQVRLAIFNVSGQLVHRLLDKRMAPGNYQIQWNGHNAAGERVGSGVYIYRLETPYAVLVRRMTLLK